MKQAILLLLVLGCFSTSSHAQCLTFSSLLSLQRDSLHKIQDRLASLGWEYRGDVFDQSSGNNEIAYCFGANSERLDLAQCWLHISYWKIFDNWKPVLSTAYNFIGKQNYLAMLASITKLGFRLDSTETTSTDIMRSYSMRSRKGEGVTLIEHVREEAGKAKQYSVIIWHHQQY